MASSEKTTDKIIVKGVPSRCTSDKLTIHFQKKKNVGGGDVQSVTFPLSRHEKDTAVVKFEDVKTVSSVLSFDHKILGNKVEVKKFSSKIFARTSAEISSHVLEDFAAKNRDQDEEFWNIEESTGAVIKGGQDVVLVEGEWYQVQAAFDMIESILYDEYPKSTEARDGNNYFSSATTRSLIKQPVLGVPAVNEVERAVSMVLEKQMFSYLKLVYSSQLDFLKKQYDVDFRIDDIDEAVKVSFTGSGSNPDTEGAVKALGSMYEKLGKSVIRKSIDLVEFPGLSSEVVGTVIKAVQPECPDVLIGVITYSKLIFIAEKEDKCTFAVDTFKYFLRNEIDASQKARGGAPQSGTRDRRNSGSQIKPSVFDKDIFKFIRKIHSAKLDEIISKFKVGFKAKEIDDAVEVVLTPSEISSDLKGAQEGLEKLYTEISSLLIQDCIDLSGKPGVDSNMIEEVLKIVEPEIPNAVMSRMHDSPSIVIFIAEKKTMCEFARSHFEYFINSKIAERKK